MTDKVPVMVERVAKAIMPDAWHETTRPDGSKYFTIVCWDEEQERARRYARAAIEAGRELTPMQEMAVSKLHLPITLDQIRLIHTAIIDSALK